jgi:hypothetical protein
MDIATALVPRHSSYLMAAGTLNSKLGFEDVLEDGIMEENIDINRSFDKLYSRLDVTVPANKADELIAKVACSEYFGREVFIANLGELGRTGYWLTPTREEGRGMGKYTPHDLFKKASKILRDRLDARIENVMPKNSYGLLMQLDFSRVTGPDLEVETKVSKELLRGGMLLYSQATGQLVRWGGGGGGTAPLQSHTYRKPYFIQVQDPNVVVVTPPPTLSAQRLRLTLALAGSFEKVEEVFADDPFSILKKSYKVTFTSPTSASVARLLQVEDVFVRGAGSISDKVVRDGLTSIAREMDPPPFDSDSDPGLLVGDPLRAMLLKIGVTLGSRVMLKTILRGMGLDIPVDPPPSQSAEVHEVLADDKRDSGLEGGEHHI